MDAFGEGCIEQGPCKPPSSEVESDNYLIINSGQSPQVRAWINSFDNDCQGIYLPWKSIDGRDRGLKMHGWDQDTGEIFEIGGIRKMIHAGHYREALTRLAKEHKLTKSQVRLIAKKLESARNLRKSFTEAVLQYTSIQIDEILATIALI
jgi:hypothetical protein